MAKALIIVESPAKAKTIARFLGPSFSVGVGGEEVALTPVVESSVGHIRDLPQNARDVPAAHKGEPWARLGIDVENDFKPLYVVSKGKEDVVRNLRREMKAADELYLATDEDREGEAIAWHLLEVLNPPPSMPVKRMVFHEITPAAIARAIENPREIDRRLVDAQEARRLLDRLYGYEVSPVLWRKVSQGLSAGRVQSVATRMVVERERERMAFVAASYWNIEGTFSPAPEMPVEPARGSAFTATLVELDGAKLASGSDFDEQGRVKTAGTVVLDEPVARALADELAEAPFTVRSVETKPYRRRPAAPFITSTFQQEAGRKLRMSASQAMRYAQSLYEGGYITYMRTDSTTLSETALAAARSEIERRFGRENLPDAPRQYTKKVRNAQEAHEAIRPAGDAFRSPDDVAREVSATEARVYDLIWKRTIASQMTDATGETVSVRLGATTPGGRDAVFATSGTVIHHQGFRLAYVEGSDDAAGESGPAGAEERGAGAGKAGSRGEPGSNGSGGEGEGRELPALAEGDEMAPVAMDAQGHETKPPARFTEASLVKRMEELGVGRPSTYASIIGTVQDRGYVWKKGTALVPSFTAFAVVGLLEQHFPHLVDYAFTARMEDDLDGIARGAGEAVPWLAEFYFGRPGAGGEREGGLKELVEDRLDEIDARTVNAIPIGVDDDGQLIEARSGRYGPYLQRGEERASIPEDLAPDELTIERAVELLEAPRGDKVLGTDPETGLPVLAKAGRFGPYVQLGAMEEGSKEKPRTASLFKTMSLEEITLADALQLLQLPRVVGVDPASGEEVLALNGRYGPYLKMGKESRSLETEEQLLTIGLEEALAVMAQPKRRRGQATPPLRELGPDPSTGKTMILKDGRFGPYVTDGETNASLRKGDDVETITPERAAELLEDRRARGPAPRKKKAAAAKKKAPAKRSAAKKKAATKKAAAKNPSKK